MKKGTKLILSILIPIMVGAISGFYTAQNISTWYVFLKKPSFNPPNYLFGPVWTVLYLLMGISFYLIIRQATVQKKLIGIYVIQLTLNFLWSFIFFKFHLIGWAFIEIILLWLSILGMIILFHRSNKWAAILNIPYLLWVSFATLLTYSIYILN